MLTSVLCKKNENSEQLRFATPIEVVEELARRFPYDPETGQYFTLVYGIVDLDDREFRYVSAGHPPVALQRGQSRITFHEATGPPVGLVPPEIMPSRYDEATVHLQHGDRLFLYSDGIPEAMSPDDEEFGSERLADVLVRTRDLTLDSSVSSLLDEVRNWATGQVSLCDDVSILAVEIDR
jgi:sigma-B regulation protein RsbU (phosphoserine phosphatase)